MYQEAVEQAARGINIFEFAQFSLTCPRTEFGILQPNPELERLDAEGVTRVDRRVGCVRRARHRHRSARPDGAEIRRAVQP